MVGFWNFRKRAFSAVLVGAVFLLSACDQIAYYNDYDSRFDWHDDARFASLTPPLGDVYSFLVISDTHIGNENDALRFEKIKACLEPSDRFVVITGDITGEGTREQLRLYLNAASSIGIPCYPVIGNHDIYTERGNAWKEALGSTVYRIDSPGTSLFILDNANGSFGYEQLEWLERELKSAGKNCFVFAHENLFVESSPPNIEQITDIRERARMMHLLKNRCAAMFMGHLHQRITGEAGGVRYIVMENYGGSGGFCRVRVSGGGISLEFGRAVL
jgi:predicted phosphodiesterase